MIGKLHSDLLMDILVENPWHYQMYIIEGLLKNASPAERWEVLQAVKGGLGPQHLEDAIEEFKEEIDFYQKDLQHD